tara:strand:- start:937 stop:1659 length:723 start_codon:yes stop_codon:yes gene_type:complete
MVNRYFDYYFYRSLENTNDKIKDLSVSVSTKSNLALFSLEQIKGRGRQNRTWVSKKGDLTCSFLIKQKFSLSDLGKINLFIVSSIVGILRKLGIRNIEFKWPNDIFIKKKKVAGVLIETNVYKGKINKLFIGIGINIVKKNLDKNLKIISLSEIDKNIDSITLFFLLGKKLSDLSMLINKIDYEYISKSLSKVFLNKNSIITINLGRNSLSGKFKKIDSAGQLVVTDNNKILKLNYGEII